VVRGEKMETNTTNTGGAPAIGEVIEYVKIGGKKKAATVLKVAVHDVVSAVTAKGRIVNLRPSKVDSEVWVEANYDDYSIVARELDAISPPMEPVQKPIQGRGVIIDLHAYVGDYGDKKGKVVILPLAGTFTSVEPSGWATISFEPFQLRSDPDFWATDERAKAADVVRKLFLPDGTRIN
jgi:hypothetical protein